MRTIHEHRGTFVPSLADGHVAGHHHDQTTAKTSNSHRKNGETISQCIHKELRSLLDDPEQDATGLHMYLPCRNNSQKILIRMKASQLAKC